MKVRVISAIVAILLALPFVYFGDVFYALGIGIIAILAFKEILDLRKSHKQFPIIPGIIAFSGLICLVYTNFNGDSTIYGATYARLIYIMLGLLIPTLFYKNETYTTKDAFYLIGSVLFLGLAFNSFILVRDKGLSTFIFLISIPIMTDTFAYIIGTLIGKIKICPSISPHKSLEGCLGGLVFGTVIPCLIYNFTINSITWKIVIGTIILSIMGQIGDLIFSKIKRENEIKDFSNLMPGHGGALDRLDSTIVIFLTYIFLTTILF